MGVRRRLLDAGLELLQEQGLAALTQPRVAKAAGVSQSHLTYYFPTRDALLLAIAEYSVDQVLAQPDIPSGTEPAQALTQAVGFLPRVRLLLSLVVAADQDPATRNALDRLVRHVREHLAGLLRQLGLAAGPDQVLGLHALVVGLAVLNLGRQNEDSAADIERGLGSMLTLLTPQTPSRTGAAP